MYRGTKLTLLILALLLIASVHAEDALKNKEEVELDEKKSAKDEYYEKMQEKKDFLHKQTKGIIMDLREDTWSENLLPFLFYLPLSGVYLFYMFISFLCSTYRACRLVCKSADPSESEIEKVDASSINLVTLKDLTELNKQRGEKRVRFGTLMFIHSFLNLRTEFEPDDVFSQKTAAMTYVHNIRSKEESYADSQLLPDEDPNDGYGRMTKESQIEVNKTLRFRFFLQIMCLLSLGASTLALSQIFSDLVHGTRVLVLTRFDNAFLRVCFGVIILCIAYRDIMQILINLACRLTGAVITPQQSRWVFVESLFRICNTLLAVLAIMVTIFSTPKDEVEEIIDQTMNFTALVILLEVDNILAGLFQPSVDKLKIDYSYNPDTVAYDFNRAADFLQKRFKMFYCQQFFEVLFILWFCFMLYCVVAFLPVSILMTYVIIPVTGH